MNTRPESRRRAPLLDVAVVGGGMVGAAAALALARAGFATAMQEARPPTPWRADDEVDLRVVGLAASSIALLDSLHVWASIRESRAASYARMHVWDARTGAAVDFDATAEGRAWLGWIAENNLVQWTLWQALDAAGVQRLCPAQVTGYEAHEDRVVLELDAGGAAVLSARLLVAADGAGSPLRRLAGLDTHGHDYGQRQQRQRTAGQEALPGGVLVRARGRHMGDDRALAVVAPVRIQPCEPA